MASFGKKAVVAMHVVAMAMCVMIALTQVQTVSARSTSVFSASVNHLRHGQHHDGVHPHLRTHSRKLSSLVQTPPLLVPYHSGPILSSDSEIPIYIIWYGEFSAAQRATVTDFFASFAHEADGGGEPSVRGWWKATGAYRDGSGAAVSAAVELKGEAVDDYSKGKTLSKEDVQCLVEGALASGAFPADAGAVYFVLTAEDVNVGTFCMNTCGSHHFIAPKGVTQHKQLPFAWVGNPGTKCAGRCAWPFAKPQYGPQTEPLVAPSGDVGLDGMLINIAAVLAGAATNPFGNAFFQGDASAPLEAATACAGTYGDGAFPGFPGALLVDPASGASYNAVGLNGRQFLLPALYDPTTLSCRVAYSPAIDLVVMDEGGSSSSRVDSQ
ncbi:protein MpEXL6 [Marchantia polymorpha subsp. ruderalis]|nr:hypothetical protein MARPO_0062s0022 [Marchantia polymorpha]BBN16286.1 hypothetical protein Mp_7g05040 [Marchantia polymorpha subsp. ruderalis]|eukprot:PTQ36596.1 hypothetical protein MARPO_0062s0022 [Marchantia polymorpha]